MNYTMLTDFYELTMANGYLKEGMGEKIAYFDMYFRQAPDGAGFAIMAGVEQMIEYMKNLKFEKEDIEYLREKKMFDEEFLQYLENFKFSCDVWAIPEGTPIFPNEPIVTVRGPLIQAQFVETMILLTINHQSLIATKSNRIVRAAGDIPVMEFGSRRAQGYDGAIYGARAAYIGGVCGTACTISEQMFDVPALGTMAHSWVQSFESEYEAFLAYAKTYPSNCTLLIDTYHVLKSGLPNAVRVFDEVLKPLGITKCGVRIDSGDITYLTKKCREYLDNAGWESAKIVISNSLDEYIIRDILQQGAKVDSFGVGERLITSKSEPVFGGVYKLVAIEENGQICPRIKVSENVAKITNPYFKKVYRLYSNDTGKAIADVLTAFDETIDETKDYEIFDPRNTWKRKTVKNFKAVELQVPIFKEGECVYRAPSIEEIREHRKMCLDAIWDEVKRFENPHEYYVDLSQNYGISDTICYPATVTNDKDEQPYIMQHERMIGMSENTVESYNLGKLGVIGMRGCEEMAQKINFYLKRFNEENGGEEIESFLIPVNNPRFGTGEAKAMILHSIRTYDIYIVMDAFNYGATYKMYGTEHRMSPDDHFQDLKRIISAMGGKAKRITVIMPMLYEGRQHKRIARESLDCAWALQELENMGVNNIITFDAHDPRVQNAIPLTGFENIQPTYQMIKACLRYDDSIMLDKENTVIVSPDEGAMGRCIYYSSVLGMDMGTCYKRRDYSTIIDGKNPIVAHEFLGRDLDGKNVIIVDDMIASGDSMIDVAKQMKKRNAKRVLVFSTFGLFTEGVEKFNQAHKDGVIDAIFTTNLVYRRPELEDCAWYHEVDMSKYIALIIKTLNEDKSISELLTPIGRIEKILDKYRNK